jgi:sialate O-acetylesterase
MINLNSLFKNKVLMTVIVLLAAVVNYSQVKLPKLISDGMVLQRDTKLKIWGWAAPEEKVTLKFLGKSYAAKADTQGTWSIFLPKQKAGGPYQMQIDASNSITINNILIGDVWVCSGQSNMELPMKRVSPLYSEEIANSKNDYIRQFAVPQKYNFKLPQNDFESGSWKSSDPITVLDFSAAAYFFAKEIYDRYNIPVGIINASLGGSPAQSWISEDALKEFPVYYEEAQKFKDDNLIKEIEESDNRRINGWYAQLNQKDEGYKGTSGKWSNANLNTSDWDTMKIPGYWTNTKLGKVNGAVWFRKNFTVNNLLAGKEAKLNLGRIVDADSTFVNGVFVGNVTYQYPPRRYLIPANVLKEGENTIVVRVVNNSGNGGFVLDKEYEIVVGEEKIDLSGDWLYKLGATMEPLGSQTFIRWKPVGLYNGMLAPLFNYKIKGAAWYQGESNVWNPIEYKRLLPALIKNWRSKWNIGNFPFLIVQLPNFMEAKPEPSESNWALMREAQLKTLSIRNTAIAVAIDIGEWNDIHPLNKMDIGKRLALAAGKIAYADKKTVCSGPTFISMKTDGNKIILFFSNTGSGLIAKGSDELKQFAIAGEDKKFVWAKTKIVGNKIFVWSDEILKPVAVRYAWADNPEGANLYNKEGLPASPFRTDDF